MAVEVPVQMLEADILIVSNLIIATFGLRSKLTAERSIFSAS